MKRYRSYRYSIPSRRKVVPTPARKRLEWQNSAQHYGFAARVALSLGFLFLTRIACADAQDGEVWGAVGFGTAAAACLLAALFLRIEA